MLLRSPSLVTLNYGVAQCSWTTFTCVSCATKNTRGSPVLLMMKPVLVVAHDGGDMINSYPVSSTTVLVISHS